MDQIWSWGLTVTGVIGMILVGQNNKAGWVVLICLQGLWFAYAIATQQWGFIAAALVYGSVYAWNLRRWHRREVADEARRCEAST